jgi:hypothetical protein
MVLRHLPLWLQHGHRVVVSMPRDSFTQIAGVECVAHGGEGYTGPRSLDRWKEILDWLWDQPYEFYLMHESDSICLSREIPEYLYSQYDVFHSNELPDNGVPPTQQVYCMAPWFFSRGVLNRLRAAAKSAAYRPPYHGDRWVGQLVEEEGIPHRLFSPGIACGTILPESSDLEQVLAAVRSGARMIHGIKDPGVLGKILGARV